ncbi:hypothetical protein BBK36DRAFT_1168517 [Trichoderma citrinoviride]|uniref:Uncharacterized protein n=1 Tax=Trichoderma citrinoviride TaxID=58853 RepID=A0A2T4BCF0_9HYPO|nr:hypothetical protein BBK36DRAFT_1168517 [Trichoderma citrinoviride]PTB67003.1 hypothetical protein BBK36DRAFT_1168517 [Trichoderma citrinoviride]
MDKQPAMLSRRELPRTTLIYIVVGLLVGVTCTAAVVAFLVVRHRKGQKYSQLRKRPTSVATTTNRESYRKSVMSTISEVDDAQRQAMIRKSLATRSSNMDLNGDSGSIYTAIHPLDRPASRIMYRAVSRQPEEPIAETHEEPQPAHHQEPTSPPSRDEEAMVGLKDDWKEWEARLHENQALSLDYHPAVAPERKDSTGSNGSAGAYRLDDGRPPRSHSAHELDRHPEPPLPRPHSVVSVQSTRSLPMDYEAKRDRRSRHQLHQSWTPS